MFIKKFIIGLLSFYAFNFRQSTRSSELSSIHDVAFERQLETRKRKQAEKKKTRLYDKHKWKKQKQFHQKSLKIKGTNPKDARFSNQQKLRRMYRST